MRFPRLVLLAALALAGCEQINTDSGSLTDKPTPPADNTAINERDVNSNTKTPIDQKETQADVDRTAAIRTKIRETENLSTNAHNVKIITEDGKVTLRGPVNSPAEKDAVEKIARDVAGAANVVSELNLVDQATPSAAPATTPAPAAPATTPSTPAPPSP